MGDVQERLLVEFIGQLANQSGFDLIGGDFSKKEQVRVRGKKRNVVEMDKFEVEALIKSPDHKDHIRIYSQVNEEAPVLVYPRKRLSLPADADFEEMKRTARGRMDAVEKRNNK